MLCVLRERKVALGEGKLSKIRGEEAGVISAEYLEQLREEPGRVGP